MLNTSTVARAERDFQQLSQVHAFITIVLFILVLLFPWLFLFLLKSSIPLGRNHCRIHIAHKRYSLLVHGHPARAPNQHILRL